jgi:hypothetical protein
MNAEPRSQVHVGRLVVDATSRTSRCFERVTVEFDFSSTSTAADIVGSVLEMLRGSHTLEGVEVDAVLCCDELGLRFDGNEVVALHPSVSTSLFSGRTLTFRVRWDSADRCCEYDPIEDEIAALKRARAVGQRKHWSSRLLVKPSRDVWVALVKKEMIEYKRFEDATRQLIHRLQCDLDAAREAQQKRVDDKVSSLRAELEACQHHVAERDKLKVVVESLKGEVDAMYDKESELLAKLRERREKLQSGDYVLSPRKSVPATSSPATSAEAEARGSGSLHKNRSTDRNANETDARSVLSPGLAKEVSDVLASEPVLSISSVFPYGHESSAASLLNQHTPPEIRRLAAELADFLGHGGNDPETQMRLLNEVREARSSIERASKREELPPNNIRWVYSSPSRLMPTLKHLPAPRHPLDGIPSASVDALPYSSAGLREARMQYAVDGSSFADYIAHVNSATGFPAADLHCRETHVRETFDPNVHLDEGSGSVMEYLRARAKDAVPFT